MTARRLLIVMLVLLGISTLAAALVPQRTLRRDTTTGTAQTQAVRPPPPPAVSGRSLIASITVGGKKVPVVAGPVCGAARKSRCEPIRVGDQVTLLVSSRFPTQLEIPEFGLVGFATAQTPARFELLPDAPNTIGVLFAPKRKVAARVEVLSAKEAAKPRSAARGGSGRP